MRRLFLALCFTVGLMGVCRATVVTGAAQTSASTLYQQLAPLYVPASSVAGAAAAVTALGTVTVQSPGSGNWLNLAAQTTATLAAPYLANAAATALWGVSPPVAGTVLAGILVGAGINWVLNGGQYQWSAPEAAPSGYSGIAPNVPLGYQWAATSGRASGLYGSPDAVCQAQAQANTAFWSQYGASTVTSITGGPVVYDCRGTQVGLGSYVTSFGFATRQSTCAPGYLLLGGECVWNAAQAPQIAQTQQQLQTVINNYITNNPATAPAQVFNALPRETLTPGQDPVNPASQQTLLKNPNAVYSQTGGGHENLPAEQTTYSDGTTGVVNTGIDYSISGSGTGPGSFSQVTFTKTQTMTGSGGASGGNSSRVTTGTANQQSSSTGAPNTTGGGGSTPPPSDMCASHPEASGCAALGDVAEPAVQSESHTLSYDAVTVGGNGVCPAPRTVSLAFVGRSVSFDFTPACNFALMFRPMIILFGALAGGYILFGGIRS
jgi:hypothetical protein